MALDTRLASLITAIGADVKALRLADGDLASLPTTAKNNLVAAIAEVYDMAEAAAAGTTIDDDAGDGDTTVTWSADKTFDEIVSAIDGLRDEVMGVDVNAALDTFGEIAAAMAADDTAAAALATAVANRVRFDAAQTLTSGEKIQARDNIGAASAADLTTTNTNLATLTTAVGNTEQDLVAAYTTAKA